MTLYPNTGEHNLAIAGRVMATIALQEMRRGPSLPAALPASFASIIAMEQDDWAGITVPAHIAAAKLAEGTR